VKVHLMQNVMGANAEYAARNRELFRQAGVLALNLMGSPGSGKTAILEATIPLLAPNYRVAVIEGDLFTTRDAARIERAGAEVVQINTGGSCHLNAKMIYTALADLPLDTFDLLFIENVGNLVCPAGFDLGAGRRVTVFGITEGADKVAKYPKMFRQSQAILINKLDLLPHTDVELTLLHQDLSAVNPEAALFHVSARTGAGLEGWVRWVVAQLPGPREG